MVTQGSRFPARVELTRSREDPHVFMALLHPETEVLSVTYSFGAYGVWVMTSPDWKGRVEHGSIDDDDAEPRAFVVLPTNTSPQDLPTRVNGDPLYMADGNDEWARVPLVSSETFLGIVETDAEIGGEIVQQGLSERAVFGHRLGRSPLGMIL